MGALVGQAVGGKQYLTAPCECNNSSGTAYTMLYFYRDVLDSKLLDGIDIDNDGFELSD